MTGRAGRLAMYSSSGIVAGIFIYHLGGLEQSGAHIRQVLDAQAVGLADGAANPVAT